MRYLVFIVLFLFCSTLLHAQVYKWVDEDGNTQYTDQPPPSSAADSEKKLKIRAAPPSAAKAESDESASQPDEMQEFKDRREERLKEKADNLAQEEENKTRCLEAQGRLKTIQVSSRLTMPDGKGGIVYVDDDMRQTKINEAQAAIAAFCK